jgi:hypothetical protein
VPSSESQIVNVARMVSPGVTARFGVLSHPELAVMPVCVSGAVHA